MTISLKHSFTSPKADGTDSTLVQPSNWNAEHTITLAAGKVLGRDSSAAGAMQELPISVDSTGQSMIPPSGTTAQRPGTAAAGMLRYNTTLSKIELYNGTSWGSVGGGGATVSDTVPASPNAGDLWWKSDEGQMYVYYNDGSSSQWVIANAFTNANQYLQLSGGTLTGGLTGTTATFSGALTGRPVPRSTVSTTTATLAWNSTNNDFYAFTALAVDLTINADAGAPSEGQKALFRIKDDGSARALTWTQGTSKSFRPIGVILPTTTTATKVTYVGCVFNQVDDRWDALAVMTQS